MGYLRHSAMCKFVRAFPRSGALGSDAVAVRVRRLEGNGLPHQPPGQGLGPQWNRRTVAFYGKKGNKSIKRKLCEKVANIGLGIWDYFSRFTDWLQSFAARGWGKYFLPLLFQPRQSSIGGDALTPLTPCPQPSSSSRRAPRPWTTPRSPGSHRPPRGTPSGGHWFCFWIGFTGFFRKLTETV